MNDKKDAQPKHEKQNYPFCRLKLLAEKFIHPITDFQANKWESKFIKFVIFQTIKNLEIFQAFLEIYWYLFEWNRHENICHICCECV